MSELYTPAAREILRQDSKIGVLATQDETGCPHLTFITSLQDLGDAQLTFGRFCKGLSKKFIEERPAASFLALSAAMTWLRGKARYTRWENTGEVFDEYNNKPMFRYNTYFGFDRVYFLDVTALSPVQKLPMAAVVCGALATRAKALFCASNANDALGVVGKELFKQLDGLKFLCYATEDGLSDIVPIIQAGPAGSGRVAFCALPYGADVRAVPVGAKAAVLALNLKMQSVLVKGTVAAPGVLDIARVYNSMPPKNRYVYPPTPLTAVTEF